jgi:hypothetical protein
VTGSPVLSLTLLGVVGSPAGRSFTANSRYVKNTGTLLLVSLNVQRTQTLIIKNFLHFKKNTKNIKKTTTNKYYIYHGLFLALILCN